MDQASGSATVIDFERHPSFEACLSPGFYSGLGGAGGGGVGGRGQKSQRAEYAAQAGNVKPSKRFAVAKMSKGYFMASAPK